MKLVRKVPRKVGIGAGIVIDESADLTPEQWDYLERRAAVDPKPLAAGIENQVPVPGPIILDQE
jgi:hypothetical protein